MRAFWTPEGGAQLAPAEGGRMALGYRVGELKSAPGRAPRSRGTLLAATFLGVLLMLAAVLAPMLRGGGKAQRVGVQAAQPRPGEALSSVPASARAQVSAALGADEPAFHVQAAAGGGLRAGNATQGLQTSFTRTGVEVRSGGAQGASMQLSLRSLGFGDAQQRVQASDPRAHANRVSYERGAVSEWYANGPAGLEQGFTLARAPGSAAAARQAPLRLTLGLGANARATLGAGSQSVQVRGEASLLRYDGLSATDATGRSLHSWMQLQGGQLSIAVDAAQARYPLRIDPLVQAGSKLTGSDEQGSGLLGTSVALSADGSTMLVGGPRDTNEGHGAAWVFVHSGTEWVQQGPKLTGSGTTSEAEANEEESCAEESPEEAQECAFGNSVALSADGNTALIGEPTATDLPGGAWVFKREGGSWTRSAELSGGSGPGEGRFGKSVALSADGTTALVGDPSGVSQRGSAWVFTSTGSSWTHQATLTDAEASRLAHVGRSVALSGDGSTALLGGPGDLNYVGAAWVFTRSGGVWGQAPGKLTGAGESGEAHFGKAVALSQDGETALIGGLSDAGSRGAVWGFGRSGSSFVQEGEKLTGAPEGEPRFGYSVALSGDGTLGLVGSPRADNGGAVTLLSRSGTSWAALTEQLAGSGEAGKGWAGAAVALSGDGEVAAVGAPHDNGRVGAAWVFADPSVVAQPAPTVSNVAPGAAPAGSLVKVKGTSFTGATAVFFGSTPASFTVKSGIVIEATAPEGLEGTVDVTVTTPQGTSAINSGDRFRYTTGTAKGGGSGNGDPENGKGGEEPVTTNGGQTGTQTQGSTSGGSKQGASGGVLGTTSAAAAACRLSLRNKHLAVYSFRTVALRLLRTGVGSCSGKLTLSFNTHAKGKRPKSTPLGTASFSIASGTSKVFKLNLNKAGRKLFRAHGGHLNVSLSIVRSVPAPKLARSASVRLAWKKTPKRVTLTK
jgi:hypothetical protein